MKGYEDKGTIQHYILTQIHVKEQCFNCCWILFIFFDMTPPPIKIQECTFNLCVKSSHFTFPNNGQWY